MLVSVENSLHLVDCEILLDEGVEEEVVVAAGVEWWGGGGAGGVVEEVEFFKSHVLLSKGAAVLVDFEF